MKLANRVFLELFGVILAATLASTATGALLLSRALRTEALTRVQLNLKEARSRLTGEAEMLTIAAQVESQGLRGRIGAPHPAGLVLSFPAGLPSSLSRMGLREEGSQKGFLLLTVRQLAELGADTSALQRLPLVGGGELLALFAVRRGPAGTAVVLSILNGNEQLVHQLQENLFSSVL
jgi:hypothetical protein